MTTHPLHADLAAVAAALAEAGAQAEAGAAIDLAGLDASVADLCAAVEALPRGEGRAFRDDLLALLAALDRLAATLTRQRELIEGGEPHSARQRAAAVYRRPATAADEPS